MSEERISLYFNDQQGSDKEYHVDLVGTPGGYLVNFRYGRRGSALATGTKTKDPVDYAKAKKVYDKLVAEKMGKGYTPSETGTAYQDTPAGDLFTGILPQLLNPVDESELEVLFREGSFVMQEKFDGERRMVSNIGGEFFGINKKGMRVALPIPVVEALTDLSPNTLLDGEIIGDVYYPFDILERDGVDLRDCTYEDRVDALNDEMGTIAGKTIIPVVCFVSEGDKRHAYSVIRERKGEGVVWKLLRGSHSIGRPNSGGDHLKFKFVESGTFLVTAQNDSKRSVQVAAFDENGNRVELGNVTIPPNYDVPDVGAIVEVEYLYAFLNGCIYQPIYRGVRTDQDIDACVTRQLKYKPMSEAA